MADTWPALAADLDRRAHGCWSWPSSSLVILSERPSVDFRDFIDGANTPMGFLLPVLGIMSVTSEWTSAPRW